jgi:hypothetical protein
LSTKSKSIILDTGDHVLRFKYDFYSQNTGIEIRVGDMVSKQEHASEESTFQQIQAQPNSEFCALYSLPIYTERWMPDGGAKKTWPKMAGFTSMEDLRCRLIITLLQNFSRQRYAHDMLYRFD